jgi:hypothetical protein
VTLTQAGQRGGYNRAHPWKLLAYLVVDFLRGILELDSLLKDAAFFVKFDGLCPIVKGASNVDFFGRMFPTGRGCSQQRAKGDKE